MPARPHLVGFKPRLLVATLGPGTFLECRCQGCGQVTRIAPWHLHARFQADARLVDVDRFWRCKRCGRSGPSWSVWQAYPPLGLVQVETDLQAAQRRRRENEFQERWRRVQDDGNGDDAA